MGVVRRSHGEWVLWSREVGDGEVEEDRGGQVRGVPTEPALRILENEAISGTWPE